MRTAVPRVEAFVGAPLVSLSPRTRTHPQSDEEVFPSGLLEGEVVGATDESLIHCDALPCDALSVEAHLACIAFVVAFTCLERGRWRRWLREGDALDEHAGAEDGECAEDPEPSW